MIQLLDKVRREYLRELRPHLTAATLLLSIGILAGILLAGHPEFAGIKMRESLGEFAQLLLNFPKPLLALAIFINNGLKTLLVIVLGVICGVVPAAFILVNGVAIGFVLQLSVQSKGLFDSLLAIVPHGVFEIPGITLGVAIGLRLGVDVLKHLFGRSETTLRTELKRGLQLFGTIIVPLLFVGAVIEAFVTAALVGK